MGAGERDRRGTRPAEEAVWPASATASHLGWLECRGRGGSGDKLVEGVSRRRSYAVSLS